MSEITNNKDNKNTVEQVESMINIPSQQFQKDDQKENNAGKDTSDKIVKTLNDVKDTAVDNINKVSKEFNSMLDMTRNSIKQLNKEIQQSRQSINRNGIAGNSKDYFKDSQKKVVNTITSSIKDLSSFIKKQFRNISDSAKNFGKKLMSLPSKIMSSITGIFGKMKDNILHSFDGIKNSFSKITDSVSHSIEKIKNVFNSIKETILHPIDALKSAVGKVKDSVMHPIDTIKGAFGGSSKAEKIAEEEKVGVAKKALSVDRVIKNSTAGVAIFWLANKMGLVGGLKEKNKKPGSGGFNFSNIGSYLKTAGLIATVAGIAYTSYKLISFGKNKISEDYKNRKSAEDVLGKKTKDISSFDRNFSDNSQALIGNTGDGSIKSRAKNSGKQALKWGGIGVGVGLAAALAAAPFTGGLSLAAIPGILATGAVAGGTAAVAGAGAGFIGGDTLSKAVIGAKDGIVKFTKGLKAKDVALGLLTGGTWLNIKAMKEHRKNQLESIKTGETANQKYKDLNNVLTDNTKISKGFGDSLLEAMSNLPGKIADWVKNKLKGGAPDTAVDRNGNVTPVSEGRSLWTRAKDVVTGGFVPSGSLLDATTAAIMKNEGAVTSVNPNDNKHGVSLGSIQWNRGRAQNYLKGIYNLDPEKFKSVMGDEVVKSLSDNKAWNSGNIVWSKTMSANYKKLVSSDKKYADYDRSQARNDIAGYIGIAEKWGITDPKAIMFIADAINQHGAGGAKQFLDNGKDLQSMYNLRKSRYGQYSRRIDSAFSSASSYGGDAGLPGGKMQESLQNVFSSPTSTSSAMSGVKQDEYWIKAIKDKHIAYLMRGDKIIKTVGVGMGKPGEKSAIGDNKTPEGEFKIGNYRNRTGSQKNTFGDFSWDIQGTAYNGFNMAGSGVEIHGGGNGQGTKHSMKPSYNNTYGCLRFDNDTMKLLKDANVTRVAVLKSENDPRFSGNKFLAKKIGSGGALATNTIDTNKQSQIKTVFSSQENKKQQIVADKKPSMSTSVDRTLAENRLAKEKAVSERERRIVTQQANSMAKAITQTKEKETVNNYSSGGQMGTTNDIGNVIKMTFRYMFEQPLDEA